MCDFKLQLYAYIGMCVYIQWKLFENFCESICYLVLHHCDIVLYMALKRIYIFVEK